MLQQLLQPAAALSAIVYDDEHIRVMWHAGTSDFVLITFGDLINLAEGDRFYADRPVAKSGFACLGLMAKAPNWYPADSVLAASRATAALLAPYRERITYGGSMGGYGAIKFSRAFGATLAIAFCPQWSIDRDECGSTDPGWTEHFTPGMKDMGVRPSDVAGKAYLFLDKYHKTDSFHGRQIASVHPQTTIINVPFCEHHVTSVLAGTKSLVDIIDYCRHDDVASIIAATSAPRRQHYVRKTVILEKALHRFPKTAHLLIASRIDDVCVQDLLTKSFFSVARSAFLNKDTPSLVAFLRAAAPFIPSLRDRLNMLGIAANATGSDIHLTTHADTLVLYDNAAGYCRHVTRAEFSEHASQFTPILLRIAGSKVSLIVNIGNVEISLYPDKAHMVSGFSSPTGPECWDIAADDAGSFSLGYNAAFLCALPGGVLAGNRPSAHAWEKFTVSLAPRHRPDSVPTQA